MYLSFMSRNLLLIPISAAVLSACTSTESNIVLLNSQKCNSVAMGMQFEELTGIFGKPPKPMITGGGKNIHGKIVGNNAEGKFFWIGERLDDDGGRIQLITASNTGGTAAVKFKANKVIEFQCFPPDGERISIK